MTRLSSKLASGFFAIACVAVAANAAVITKNMVTDYGMQAANAKPAIDTAVAAAKSYLAANPNDEVVLYFPAGTWNVDNSSGGAGINIGSLAAGKITLRGESSSLTKLVFFKHDENGILIFRSDYVTVERMHLTRPISYSSQGDVVSTANGVVRMRPHAGFLDPITYRSLLSSTTHETVLVPFDGDAMNPIVSAASPKMTFTSITDVGGGLYDFTTTGTQWRNLVPGQKIAMKCKGGASAIFGQLSDYTTIQDIRITNSSGNGVWMRNGDHQIMRRITVDRGDPINGVLPFLSQPSDGLHAWFNQGGGDILIEDNTIIGPADDGIAVISTDATYTPGLYATNIIIRNNTVRMGLARSIILNMSDGAQIHGNTLSSISMQGILINGAKNTLVYNNSFVDNRIGQAIRLERETVTTTTGGSYNYNPAGNIIQGNVFDQASKDTHLILVRNATNTTVDGNYVSSWSNVAGYTGSGVNLVNPAPLLYATSSTTITGSNYLVALPGNSMPLVSSSASSGITANWAVNRAPQFTATPLNKATATETSGYSASISGSATDLDSGQSLSYSLVSGPSWLAVASSGELSGTPSTSDIGANQWTVQVSDGYTAATATLNIAVQSAFDGWANGSTTFSADGNNDGLADGLAWLLSSASPSQNARALLPENSFSGGDLLVSFSCLVPAKRGAVTLKLEYSKDLGIADPWSNHSIEVPATSSTVSGVGFVVTPVVDADYQQVQATIPAAVFSGTGRIFVRLSAEASAL